MYLKTLNLRDIHPYERNPRINAKAVEPVMKSIQKDGYRARIIVDNDGVIIAGHTRYEAMKRLGWTEAEVWIADDMTPEQIADYRIRDNLTADFAEWDFGELEAEIAEMDLDFDMSEFEGFEDIQGGVSYTTTAEEDDFDEDVPIEPKAKPGDIYQLGQHRLICGDSTDVAVIDRLMDGAKADMVFTDSPYGINAVNDDGVCVAYGDNHVAQRGKYAKVIGDDTTETAQQAYNIYSQLCDKMILWGGNYFLDFLPSSDGWLIWDKRGESGIRNTFADGEMAWCSFHTPVRIYHQLWNGMIREGEHEKRVHPTQKPIRMLSEILQDFTNEGDIILDVFGGSGSTLIACEQTGRTCYMAELSPEYVDVIIARYEKLTGNKAVLLNG